MGDEITIGSIDIESITLPKDYSHMTRGQYTEIPGSARFYLFPMLPIELRLQVWQLASLSPIVVKFSYRLSQRRVSFAGRLLRRIFATQSPAGSLHVSGPVPALLHACSESRELMKTYYTPAFSSLVGHPVWFNYTTDILLLHNISRWWFEGFPPSAIVQALGPVQHLIVEDKTLTSTIRFIFERMQVLEDPATLYLVVPDRLAQDFRVAWLSLIKREWAKHCDKVAKGEGGRQMTRRLEILFGTPTKGVSGDVIQGSYTTLRDM